MTLETGTEPISGSDRMQDPAKLQPRTQAANEASNPVVHDLRNIFYHVQTLYLFTRSDFKSIVLPQSLFAIACAMSAVPLTQGQPMQTTDVILRTPFVVGWIWIHLLVENIENQRSDDSIIEDRLNKPWRPLPSGRLTSGQARTWVSCAVYMALTASTALSALKPGVILLIHIWLYNGSKWEGSSHAVWVRNAFNAGGIMCFSWGALSAMISHQPSAVLLPQAYAWILINGAVVMTTVHAQDMPDVEGDLVRGRATLPLKYGERWARWSLATMVMMWSILCPLLWHGVSTGIAFLPVAVGSILSLLTTSRLGRRIDEVVWLLWGGWVTCLDLLPLFSRDQSEL